MHLRSPLSPWPQGVITIEKHGRERCLAQLLNITPEEQLCGHVHSGAFPWMDFKPVCAGEAGAIKQAIHHHYIAVCLGPLHPEFGERGELLAGWQACIDGYAPP